MSLPSNKLLPEIAFATAPARLIPGPLHVWRLLAEEVDLLSNEERAHADKFQSGPARAEFVIGRSGIRRAAAIYTGSHPRDLVISTSPSGKPSFANAAIHFNLSHSGGIVVAAFSGSPVGIDIEPRGRRRDIVGIAERFFHPAEAEVIRHSPDEDQFLRLWTGKEAMLKLSGEGISGGLAEARPGTDGTGTLRGQRVGLAAFSFDRIAGAVASFGAAEVKGWFQT
jgi:4'-phosphopantetheinyl transferase